MSRSAGGLAPEEASEELNWFEGMRGYHEQKVDWRVKHAAYRSFSPPLTLGSFLRLTAAVANWLLSPLIQNVKIMFF